MRSYLLSFVGVALLCGVLELITPEHDGMRKHLRMLCGLCVLCLAISPLMHLLEALREGEIPLLSDGSEVETTDYESVFQAHLLQQGRAQTERALADALCREFERQEGELAVRLHWEETEERVGSAMLILYGEGWLADPAPMRDRLEEWLGCPCEVLYEG